MTESPRTHDPMDDIVRKAYVLPKDDKETPTKVAALEAIARQHKLEVESRDRPEDGKMVVTFRGTLRAISNAAHTVRSTAELTHVFTSELLGDVLKEPPKQE